MKRVTSFLEMATGLKLVTPKQAKAKTVPNAEVASDKLAIVNAKRLDSPFALPEGMEHIMVIVDKVGVMMLSYNLDMIDQLAEFIGSGSMSYLASSVNPETDFTMAMWVNPFDADVMTRLFEFLKIDNSDGSDDDSDGSDDGDGSDNFGDGDDGKKPDDGEKPDDSGDDDKKPDDGSDGSGEDGSDNGDDKPDDGSGSGDEDPDGKKPDDGGDDDKKPDDSDDDEEGKKPDGGDKPDDDSGDPDPDDNGDDDDDIAPTGRRQSYLTMSQIAEGDDSSYCKPMRLLQLIEELDGKDGDTPPPPNSGRKSPDLD